MALVALLACSICDQSVIAASPAQDAIAYLQNRFGLNERQAQDAVGALLLFAREQVAKPEFDELASRMPRADLLMQAVQAQGVVTAPLSRIDDYQACLIRLGIDQRQATQIAPAVVDYLGQAGFDQEQAILQDIILR